MTSQEAQLLVKASQRVGHTPEARVEWLLSFARRDLKSEGELVNSVWEVCAFTIAEQHGELARLANFPPGGVADAQRELRKCLDVAKGHSPVWWCPGPLRIGLVRVPDRGVQRVIAGDHVPQFLVAAINCLNRVELKLRGCVSSSCGELFFGRMLRQKYCSTRCENREAVAKHRRAHRERISERRHRRYAAKQRERFGAPVKVSRRPRRKGA